MFESSFFPYTFKEWSHLNEEIRNTEPLSQFRKTILSPIRPKQNSVFSMHNFNNINLLSHLRLNLNHLNEQEFQHNLKDTIDPICSCGLVPETIFHYILHCNLYSTLKVKLMYSCAIS